MRRSLADHQFPQRSKSRAAWIICTDLRPDHLGQCANELGSGVPISSQAVFVDHLADCEPEGGFELLIRLLVWMRLSREVGHLPHERPRLADLPFLVADLCYLLEPAYYFSRQDESLAF